MARKRFKRKLPKSYAERKAIIRQFENYPNRELTAKEKRRITLRAKRWLDKSGQFAAIKATEKEKRAARKAGFETTNKGIVAPVIRPGGKRRESRDRVLPGGIVQSKIARTKRAVGRTDTFIQLSNADKAVLARNGTEALLRRLAKNPDKRRYVEKLLKGDPRTFVGVVYKGGGLGLKSYSPDALDQSIESGKRKLTRKIEGISIQVFGKGMNGNGNGN